MFDKWWIKAHMEVIGRDGRHLGTVDHVAGDLIKLAKSDPADRLQHVIPADKIDRVKNNRLYVNVDDTPIAAA